MKMNKTPCEKSLHLNKFRKCFESYLKSNDITLLDSSLINFNQLISIFTIEELVNGVKEVNSFCSVIVKKFVADVRSLASTNDLRQAAVAVFSYIEPSNEKFTRGWFLLKSIAFLTNNASKNMIECFCKGLLPSTIVKIFNLFMDLSIQNEISSYQINDSHRWLYDSLVLLMVNLCSQEKVAEALTQGDEIFSLFDCASHFCLRVNSIWRDAMFSFLCTIVGKALSPRVSQYIHIKRCMAHYVSNLEHSRFDYSERITLLSNLIDLMRSSADTTTLLIDDFFGANGSDMIVRCCKNASSYELDQFFRVFCDLITAGNTTIDIILPNSNMPYDCKLEQHVSRSTGTIRIFNGLSVLQNCFYEGNDELSVAVLNQILYILKGERMNYFVINQYCPLNLFMEKMLEKGEPVHKSIFHILEFVIRELNFIPVEELVIIRDCIRNSLLNEDYCTLKRFLDFIFSILSINLNVKDSYRELGILLTIIDIIKSTEENASEGLLKLKQISLDLLLNIVKGSPNNASYIIEHTDIHLIKSLLISSDDVYNKDEMKNCVLALIKHLLILSRNEQMFSSLLQLMFSDPSSTNCTEILKVFSSTLVESHKIRIMFRKSGGYICLMTLLLNLEKSLYTKESELLCSFINRTMPTLAYISLIFHVLTVSLRYEPSNARYFLVEVRPNIINSILRSFGCFNENNGIDVQQTASPIRSTELLKNIHFIFSNGQNIFLRSLEKLENFSPNIFAALYIMRLLFDLAFDYDKRSESELIWADEKSWLQTPENTEIVPLFKSRSLVLVHPTGVVSMLTLLPSIFNIQSSSCTDGNITIAAQFYISLILRTILRTERHQQILCNYDIPRILLEVGSDLFKLESDHPLLSSFNYMFERLAQQKLHPRELRHFLRLDEPLHCMSLEDLDTGTVGNGKVKRSIPQSSIPIHRVKALVSILTPRNHALANPPAFIEFDFALEGFSSLFIPSLVNWDLATKNQLNSDQQIGKPSLLTYNFTFLVWFCVDDFSSPPKNCPRITVVSIIRRTQSTEYSIETCATFFEVILDINENSLIVSFDAHSTLEVNDFGEKDRHPHYIKHPLPEDFSLNQWNHLAIVASRLPTHKQQCKVDIIMNDRCICNQMVNVPSHNFTQTEAICHGIVGTPPYFRRISRLRWKVASLYFIDDVLTSLTISQIFLRGATYSGNFQTNTCGIAALINEEKICISLSAKSSTETNAETLLPIIGKPDCELIVTLLGISLNDTSTPLRVLRNMNSASNPARSFGAVLIGYLGIRSFVPNPVYMLIDSVGGLSPLIGLLAMSTDSNSLYAALKVLNSALNSNHSLLARIEKIRGYQTLAVLLEEKANFINSHILHLLLTLIGTVDGRRENIIIPNVKIFDDFLYLLDSIWKHSTEDIVKFILEHISELITDNPQNVEKLKESSLLTHLLTFLFENATLFCVKNGLVFRLIQFLIQPPCVVLHLLRIAQTISATIDYDRDETNYPFYTTELENNLIKDPSNDVNLQKNSKKLEPIQPEDTQLYSIYLRNKLLLIIVTTLDHSNTHLNYQFCEQIVKNVGFGWILTLCAPQRIHPGTTFLAFKILLHTLKYQKFLEMFRDGCANDGWLDNVDSVVRNRAAVLLGFSVSAGAGPIGGKIDINPELSTLSAFATLDQICCSNIDKPFVYMSLFAILFQRWQVDIRPIDEFTIDIIWSHIFQLNDNSSVSDVIDELNFCPDAVIPILSMVRANNYYIPKNENEMLNSKHWSCRNPFIIMQFFAFLYQNSAPFFSLSQTETFILGLFTTLVPPASTSNNLKASIIDESDAENYYDNVNRSKSQIIGFLTNCILNDLCIKRNDHSSDIFLFEPLIEYLETDSNCTKHESAFTEFIDSCLDQLVASKIFFATSVISTVPSKIKSLLNSCSEETTINVLAFLTRILDTLWNCLYRGNGIRILKCFLKLFMESHVPNKATYLVNCTTEHIRSMFRLILFLLSRPIDNIDSQMSVVDTLAEILRNQQIFLTSNAEISPLYFGALAHLIFMLSDKAPDDNDGELNRQLERGSAQVAICTQSVWGILWQHKKDLLNDLFERNVDLDLYTARIACAESANLIWLKFVDSQTNMSFCQSPNPKNVQNKGTIQHLSKLSRAAKGGLKRLTSRRSISSQTSLHYQTLQILSYDRLKIDQESFNIWVQVHLSLVKVLHPIYFSFPFLGQLLAQIDLFRNTYVTNAVGSELDKYELDTTEGSASCRVRKLLVPNLKFYQHYPYRPQLDTVEAKAFRSKFAISNDSKLYYERVKNCRVSALDENIIDLTPLTLNQSSVDEIIESGEINISLIKNAVRKNLEAIKLKSSDENDINQTLIEADAEEENAQSEEPDKNENSPVNVKDKSSKNEEFDTNSKTVGHSGPDNQALLFLLEKGESLHSMFRCARIHGLETMEGLLLFGDDNFYIVDGFTLLKTKEIRDLDFLPEQYHDPIIPYIAMGSKFRQVRMDRQSIRFSYTEVKEIYKRRYLLQPIALEIFSTDGRNYLLAFPRKVRNRVYQKIITATKKASADDSSFVTDQKKSIPAEIPTSSQLINSFIGQQSITQKWQNGEISNFEYLMRLNTLAGRSYNDLLPWVLADYESKVLDLTNSTTFRDLSKPMGAQTPERMVQFLKRYKEWDTIDPTGDTPPYMYGTHYSSSMIVLSYLVRLEPFAQQFLSIQGGHFDLADRMFHSIKDAYSSASKNNMADVKELIPEFFYLPEMFKNVNNFDLGTKQNGVRVHDVELPPWSNYDPIEFVKLHRQALESDYVSQNLHHWIDLIFGYKQSGEAAKAACNVFHHLFYEENVNFESIEDPLTRNATLGFINNFGQIPTQLFKKPHPQRKSAQIPSDTISIIPGITTDRFFYHCLDHLHVSPKPVKELNIAVGEIYINNKNQVIVLEQNRALLPPTNYLAWGFYDQSIRIGTVGTKRSFCILEICDFYEITCIAVNYNTVFMGLTTGAVLIWTLFYEVVGANTGSIYLIPTSRNRQIEHARLSLKRSLDGHTDVITVLNVCPEYNILLTGGRDKVAIIWHLTQHIYIRQLKGHPGPLTAACINETNGDIAIASGSYLYLWSINGVLLATIRTAETLFSSPESMILCVEFSTINDWDPQNVVMVGTSDGYIKIYSFEFDANYERGHSEAAVSHTAGTGEEDAKLLKSHLLRRQRHIQAHRNSKHVPLGPLPIDSQRISDLTEPLFASSVQSKSDYEQGPLLSTGRTLRLRKKLGDYTAFNQNNTHPAPITCITITKDHKSILVGDGIGRVWMWS